MKTPLLNLLLFSLAFQAAGQVTAPGAESAALGGISVVLSNPWSTAANPAGLAGLKQINLGTSLEQRFLLKELGLYSLALTIPSFSGSVGCCMTYEGYELYRKYALTCSYGRSFGESISIGIGLYYLLTNPGTGYSIIHQVSYSLGVLVKVSNKLLAGLMAFNPFNYYYRSEPFGQLPVIIRAGFTYRPAEPLAIMLEIEKDIEYNPMIKIGLEYNAGNKLYLRGGFGLFPANYGIGAGIRFQNFLVGISLGYHQYLGATPCSSILYSMKHD